MDAFDFQETKPERAKPSLPKGWLWYLGALYFVGMTFLCVSFYALTFIDPYNRYNVFPPPTQVILLASPTPRPVTATNTPSPSPSSTFTVTPSPTGDGTPTATEDLQPSATNIVLGDTSTPGPSGKPVFQIQPGNPLYLTHPDGCDGLYLGGNVIDLNGNPSVFMIVRLQGSLNGESLGIEDALSGTAPQFSESGYQIKFSDTLTDSSGTVFVELYHQDFADDPVSQLIIINTFNDCEKNLIMINWVQTE